MSRILGVDIGTTRTKLALLSHGEAEFRSVPSPQAIIKGSMWYDFLVGLLEKFAGWIGSVDALCVTATAPDVFVMTSNRAEAGLRFFSDEAYELELDLDAHLMSEKWANEVLSKLIWLQSKLQEPIVRWFSLNNLLVYFLTDEYWIDSVVAGECGTLVDSNGWNTAILERFGLNDLMLPAIGSPVQIVGPVVDSRVRAVLGRDCVVVLGSSDSLATALGAGLEDTEDILVYFGTFNSATRILRPMRDVFDPASDHAFRMFDWFCSLPRSGRQLDGLVNVLADGNYEQFFALASVAAPGSRGVRFVHTPLGTKSTVSTEPYGAYFGLPADVGRSDMARAILEGFGFSLVLFAEAEALDLTSRRAFCAGGGARQQVWRQIVADSTGMDVHYFPDADLGAGTAMLAQVALAADGAVPMRELSVLRPNQDRRVRYLAALEDYRTMFGFSDLTDRRRADPPEWF